MVAREFQKSVYFCFIDYVKTFNCVDHNKLENSARDGNIRPPDLPPEKKYAGPEATVRTEHGKKQTDSKLGKKHVKAVYCHPAYLTYMQSSVRFSHSVVSKSLRPHGLQQSILAYPSPTPRVHSNSCPLSRSCHPTISSNALPFCLQSFPASGSFQMSHFFHIRWPNIGVSTSASVLPMNIQD